MPKGPNESLSNLALCRGRLLCGGPSQPWLPCTVGSAALALHRSRGLAFQGARCTKSSALVEVTVPKKPWMLDLIGSCTSVCNTFDVSLIFSWGSSFSALKEDNENGYETNEAGVKFGFGIPQLLSGTR